MYDMQCQSSRGPREEDLMINEVMNMLLTEPECDDPRFETDVQSSKFEYGHDKRLSRPKRSVDEIYSCYSNSSQSVTYTEKSVSPLHRSETEKYEQQIDSYNYHHHQQRPCKRELLKKEASWTKSQEDILNNAVPIPVTNQVPEPLPNKRENMKRSSWTRSQDDLLVLAVSLHGGKNWKEIAKCLPGRNHVQCLQRWQKVLMPGLRKGPWSPEEDALLTRLVSESETISWLDISTQIKGRTTKQCRERWTLCLDPTINRNPWTPSEDAKLLALYEVSGPQWCLMKEEFENRTPNQLKSRYAGLVKRNKTKK